jgi:hypothetical protein
MFSNALCIGIELDSVLFLSMFDCVCKHTLMACCERKDMLALASMNLVLIQVSRSLRILLHESWFCLVNIVRMVSDFIVRSIE